MNARVHGFPSRILCCREMANDIHCDIIELVQDQFLDSPNKTPMLGVSPLKWSRSQHSSSQLLSHAVLLFSHNAATSRKAKHIWQLFYNSLIPLLLHLKDGVAGVKGNGLLFLIQPTGIKKCWIPNADGLSGEQWKKLIPQSSWMVWTLPFEKLSWAVLPAFNQYISILPRDSCSLDSLPQWYGATSILLPSHAALRGGLFSLKLTDDSSEIEKCIKLFK